MKSLILALAIACASLAGCAQLQQTIQNAVGVFKTVSTTSVSAQQVSIAASTFDALENSGAAYLRLPLCSAGGPAACRTQAISQTVYSDLLKGRAARNQLEAQINSGTNGTASLYNVLVTAINSLESILH